ncbi:MAG: DUF1428 domain-containing protein [Pyrinomonadaceae bacterium]
MSKYTDVYLLPIPEENIPAYKKMATTAAKLFLKHGALRYREYVASDLATDWGVPFTKIVKLKEGETLIYAAVEFNSEAHRNKAMKALYKDPEMEALMPGKPLFNYKKMVYGGFKVLVDL